MSGKVSKGIRKFFLRVFRHEKLQEAIFVFLFAGAMLMGNWVCGEHWVLGFVLGAVVFGFFTLGFQWLIGDVEFGEVGEAIGGAWQRLRLLQSVSSPVYPL